jgi:hypothetical protein
MQHVRAFIAGFVSTLVFHQGLMALFYVTGIYARSPYSMDATAPLGVPAVLSLAFWGGVWGLILWPLIRDAAPTAYWLRALLVGAVGPSAVALLVVMPLKGLPLAGGWDPRLIAGALMVNGVWGLGVALILRVMNLWAPANR